MFNLHLTRGGHREGVHLGFPASPGEVGEAFAWLDSISTDTASTRILDVACTIRNLEGYIINTDLSAPDAIEKLNLLTKKISAMDSQEQQIFSGALDAESVNGLDDVLSIAGSLDAYTFLLNICSDRELGIFLVDTGYKNFPEAVRPYLDYRAIGAEYYAECGGAYSPFGYVRRKDTMEQAIENRTAVITIHLRTLEADETMSKHCCLLLPAADEELDRAKTEMNIDCFTDAYITRIEFGVPYLEELIPQDCFCVEDANELALAVEEMQKTDGELLKFCSVLEVEQPQTFGTAVKLSMELDDYERAPNDPEEYGQSVLRRIGVDDEIIDTIDGYMDFERFGEAMMEEDGVRQTEFGLIRRLSEPFPSEQQGQTFQ